MVKECECRADFPFAWSELAVEFWRRYPNPFSSHVLSEDTLVREVLPGGVLYSVRLLTKTNKMPAWGRWLTKARTALVVERSWVDPARETIITDTRNLGFTRIARVEEHCVYKPCGSKTPSSTPGNTTFDCPPVVDADCPGFVCSRRASITSSVRGLSRAIEAFGVKRFTKNVVKTNNGLLFVLCQAYAPHLLDPAEESRPAAVRGEEGKAVSDKRRRFVALPDPDKIREAMKKARMYAAHKSNMLHRGQLS